MMTTVSHLHVLASVTVSSLAPEPTICSSNCMMTTGGDGSLLMSGSLSEGVLAGLVVMALLLVVSLLVNVITVMTIILLLRRHSTGQNNK